MNKKWACMIQQVIKESIETLYLLPCCGRCEVFVIFSKDAFNSQSFKSFKAPLPYFQISLQSSHVMISMLQIEKFGFWMVLDFVSLMNWISLVKDRSGGWTVSVWYIFQGHGGWFKKDFDEFDEFPNWQWKFSFSLVFFSRFCSCPSMVKWLSLL